MTDAIALHVLNEDGTQKFNEHGQAIYTDEAKATYAFGEDGKPLEDADGALVKLNKDPAPIPNDTTQTGSDSSTEQEAAASGAAVEGTGEAVKEPVPPAPAPVDPTIGTEADGAPSDTLVGIGHSVNGDGLDASGSLVPVTPAGEAAAQAVVDARKADEQASAANVGTSAANASADSATALAGNGTTLDAQSPGMVLNAAQSVAEDAHGVLSEIEGIACYWGGEVLHEIRTLVGKAKALIDAGKAKVTDEATDTAE